MADYFHGVLRRSKPAGRSGSALPSLDDLLEDYIDYLMRLTSNNISLTARILKISRSTLYYRMYRCRRRDGMVPPVLAKSGPYAGGRAGAAQAFFFS